MSERSRRRIGVYGWGVVAPGARDVGSLVSLLRSGGSGLATSTRDALGRGLFAVGEPAFAFEDYQSWIAERHGETYCARLRSKMNDNVQFAVGATIQALQCDARLEKMVRELDEQVHVYIGSGVGDLPTSYTASTSLGRATRAWNRFWAESAHNTARRRFASEGTIPDETHGAIPVDPSTYPVDSEARADAHEVWDAFWAAHSPELAAYLKTFAEIEHQGADDADAEKAAINGIRKRVRAHRTELEAIGAPPPPWTSVDSTLIWNIQNAPAAQITMLLGVHGAAWAPVGACSTFGVVLKCGMDAIELGDAKLAVVGSTDPRPDPALVGAFHNARVMPGIGEVNKPLTTLRGTHVSGGSCVWIIGDAEYCEAQGLTPLAYVDAVALASDAEHIITPSKTGPKRAIERAYADARIAPGDVAIADLHATGTPGDLNELALVDSYLGNDTVITARKGQLGHGMANSGGWELTALAIGLSEGAALPTGIKLDDVHCRVERPERIVTESRPVTGKVGIKMMLGVGGITACVVIRAPG
jgi:3-oxoacyl-[acyl-carrier-protein] synthase II